MTERQVIERVRDAPIRTIRELWTPAEGIASWFGPRGFTVEVESIDLREGGSFRYTMRMDTQPAETPGRVVVSTITGVDPPRRFAYDSPWAAETMTRSVEFTAEEGGVKRVLEISATKAGMTEGATRGRASSPGRFDERLGRP